MLKFRFCFNHHSYHLNHQSFVLFITFWLLRSHYVFSRRPRSMPSEVIFCCGSVTAVKPWVLLGEALDRWKKHQTWRSSHKKRGSPTHSRVVSTVPTTYRNVTSYQEMWHVALWHWIFLEVTKFARLDTMGVQTATGWNMGWNMTKSGTIRGGKWTSCLWLASLLDDDQYSAKSLKSTDSVLALVSLKNKGVPKCFPLRYRKYLSQFQYPEITWLHGLLVEKAAKAGRYLVMDGSSDSKKSSISIGTWQPFSRPFDRLKFVTYQKVIPMKASRKNAKEQKKVLCL